MKFQSLPTPRVWLCAGGVGVILPDVQFGTVSL